MAPGTEELERQALVRFIEDGFLCAQACTECASVCLRPPECAEPDAWNRLDIRCADICEHTGRMLTQSSRYDAIGIRAQVELCAATCRACAEDYERLAGSDGAARERVEACRRCEEACTAFLENLP